MSATALAREVGVPQSTLSRWLRVTGRVGGNRTVPPIRVENPVKKRPEDRSPEERLRIVIEANSIAEEDLGAFLRREGIHQVHLDEWRKSALGALGAGAKSSGSRSPQTRRIRELERELRRKDKALAEAAALLVLQKKVRALWPDEEDDTTLRNGN